MSIRRRFERLAAMGLACLAVGSSASASDDLEPYRHRFRQGMEKYKAGAIAEAIRAWSAIYDELGPKRGYRLSFDLARAYEASSETSRAAERYQSFLDEVAARRAASETLDPIVEREEEESERRMAELKLESGRIRILPGTPSAVTRIDSADPRLGGFVSYVVPGDHVVVFAPGSAAEERREVRVEAGEMVDVSPTARPEPSPTPPAPPALVPLVTRPEPDKASRIETQRPFSPVVIYVAVGISGASVLVPILAYAHAYSLIDTHNAGTTANSERRVIEAEYPGARVEAYATLAASITLAAATGALVAYYFGGSKEREVQVGAALLPGRVAADVSVAF
jgi:hypothetical protein